ncbi:MAG: hypothetical protein QM756_09505 [Polyangiaceae bacterium]
MAGRSKAYLLAATWLSCALSCGKVASDEAMPNSSGGVGGALGGQSAGGSSGVGETGGTATEASASGGAPSASTSGGANSTNAGVPSCPAILELAPPGQACVGREFEPPRGLDLFLLLDRSCSMNRCPATLNRACSAHATCPQGSSQFHALQAGLLNFISSSSFTDLYLGVDVFPAVGSDASNTLACDVNSYAQPAVAITPIHEVGNAVAEVLGEAPTASGATPLEPALDGALRYAKSWAALHPERQTAVVLVTGSYPTQCESAGSFGPLFALTSAAYASPPRVLTFVIGLPAAYDVNVLARAGGTDAAFDIDKYDFTPSSIEATLRQIADTAPCSIPILPMPEGQELDPNKVQVFFTDPEGNRSEVPDLPSAASCERQPNGGWYYDDLESPTRVRLCPCSCQTARSTHLSLAFGCDPYRPLI